MDATPQVDQGILAVTEIGLLGDSDVADTRAAGRRDGTSLVALPLELLVLILTNLDHKDLLQCCAVCKHLRAVILGDVRLQYTIELAADGMVDGHSCDMFVKERLQILLDQRVRWRSAKWLAESTVRLPWLLLYRLVYADGVLVAPCTSQPSEAGYERFILCSMPSRYVGDHRIVPLYIPAENVAAVALDVTQDLIILVGVAAGDQGGHGMEATFTVYPHSISSSAADVHPRCQQSEFGRSVGLEDQRTRKFDCAICGHSFGMSICDETEVNAGFHIWDWTTGERLAWIQLHRISRGLPFSSCDFSFLLPDLILVSAGSWSYRERGVKPFLHVLAIGDAHGGSPWCKRDGTIKHLVRLDLPEVAQGPLQFDGAISTGPTYLGPGRGKPFEMTVSSHIYRVDIRPCTFEANTRHGACLFVHRDTIMRLASEHAHMTDGSTTLRAVPWEKWGPDNTRIITTQESREFEIFLPIHGERSVVNVVDQDTPDGALHILDFNIRRSRPTSIDNGSLANAQLISKPSTINIPECFPEPVTTHLPYYSTPLPNVPNDHIVVMDQDRIVAIQNRTWEDDHNSDALADAGIWVF